MKSVVAVILLLAASVGCSDTPTSPSGGVTGLSGTWSGTLTDASNGAGSLRISLSDRGVANGDAVLDGTWSTSFPDNAKNGSGQAIVTVTNGAPLMALLPAVAPPCVGAPFPNDVGNYVTTRLSVSGSALSGAYIFGSCTGAVTGTLELRRQ